MDPMGYMLCGFLFFLPNLFPRFPRLKTSRTLSLFVVFEWLRVHITLKICMYKSEGTRIQPKDFKKMQTNALEDVVDS